MGFGASGTLEEFLPEDLALNDLVDGQTEVAPDRLQILRLDLLLFLYFLLLFAACTWLFVNASEECALKCIAVKNAHLPEDDHARGRFFGCFVCKLTVREGEKFVSLPHKVGYESY